MRRDGRRESNVPSGRRAMGETSRFLETAEPWNALKTTLLLGMMTGPLCGSAARSTARTACGGAVRDHHEFRKLLVF
jgi:hypothetical protein